MLHCVSVESESPQISHDSPGLNSMVFTNEKLNDKPEICCGMGCMYHGRSRTEAPSSAHLSHRTMRSEEMHGFET